MIREDEAEMMERVITEGIPEDRKESITSLLQRIPSLPKSLVIDAIGVNKNPNKRLMETTEGGFVNVAEGAATAYDENTGLMVSCLSRVGTIQPIEISLKRHLWLNRPTVSRPHISNLMEEYYRLSKLNWVPYSARGSMRFPRY